MTTCHGYKEGNQGPRVTSTLKLLVLTRAKLKTKAKMKVKKKARLKTKAKKKDGEEG